MSAEAPVPVGNLVFHTPQTATQAQGSPFCQETTSHFVEIGGAGGFEDCQHLHISVLHSFCAYLQDTVEARRDQPIIICPEDASQTSVGMSCLLCGAYLLLCERKGLAHVLSAFESTLSRIAATSERNMRMTTSITDCWTALSHACALRWLGAANETTEPMLDVQRAAHYARPSNGHVHVLVPGKLLLFPTPASFPAGQEWGCSSSAPTVRAFSAGFLADLAADLGVSTFVCVGQTGGRDAATFAARGMDVHDLGLDPRRPALLLAVDRLIAISRASPGAVALFGCQGEALAELVGTLVAAYLMVEQGFCAAAATSWIGMLCPCLLRPPRLVGPVE